MKIKKFAVALTVISLLMSSIVCSAATYSTTTAYDASGNLLSLTTEVSGLTEGSMVTYALYGKDGSISSETGAITSSSETGITEENLIYIDQVDSASATETFTVKGVSAETLAGSKIIVGAEDGSNATDSDTESNGFVGTDDLSAKISLASDIEWEKINQIDVSYGKGDSSTATYTLTENGNTSCYVPVGYDVVFNVDGKVGYNVSKITLGNTELPSPYKTTVTSTSELVLDVDMEDASTYVEVDSEIVKNAEEKSVTFFITDANSDSCGVNVYVKNGDDEVKIEGLEHKSTAEGGRYAIKVVDDGNADFYNDSYTYRCVPVYKSGDTYIELSNANEGYYYKSAE